MPYNRIITSYEFPRDISDNQVNQTQKLYHINEELIKNSEYTRAIKCLHGDIFSYNCIVSSNENLEKYLIDQKKKFKETRSQSVFNKSKEVILKNISSETLDFFLLKEKEIYKVSQFNINPNILTLDNYLFNSFDFISDHYLTIIDYYISAGKYSEANYYLNRYFTVFNNNTAVLRSKYRPGLIKYISRMTKLTKNQKYNFIAPENYSNILRSSKTRITEWENIILYERVVNKLPKILFLLNPDEIINESEYYTNQIQKDLYHSSFKTPWFYNPLNSYIYSFNSNFSILRGTIDLMNELELKFNKFL